MHVSYCRNTAESVAQFAQVMVGRMRSLSFDETGIRVGWDCGRYFVERVATGERFEESVVGTNGTPRVLDWNCTLQHRRMKSLFVSNEIAVATFPRSDSFITLF